MGIFDFVKDAGESLFGDDAPETTTIDRSEIDAIRKGKIEQRLGGLDVQVEGLAVAVSGNSCTLTGQVANQSCAEKLTLAAGNVAGIQQVDCQLDITNPEPEPESTMYTVQSGDTLGGIAKAHYGDAGKYPVIFEANQPLLTDPNKIYPGQVLRIPALD